MTGTPERPQAAAAYLTDRWKGLGRSRSLADVVPLSRGIIPAGHREENGLGRRASGLLSGEACDPVSARVHVESLAARESDERHAVLVRQGDRQAGGRSDRDDKRHARHRGLLHDLEARAAAHGEDPVRQRDAVHEELFADDLVDRIVPADVLPYAPAAAGGVEQPGAVEAARPREQRLPGPEALRDRGDRLGGGEGRVLRDRMAGGHADGLQGGLAADAAAGRHVEVAAQPVRVELDVGAEDRAHDVVLLRYVGVRAVLDAGEVALPGDDPLRQEEPGRELEVVSRRPHRDGQRRGGVTFSAVLHADLQRLLRRKTVAFLDEAPRAPLPYLHGRYRAGAVHGAASRLEAFVMRTRAL